ncbi:protein of unknown function [Taphrina deformans PYCC 5710]|uniref:Uncharacterized protein n=1 Tax=Taphrina deformans (strain PYCC 5710 / ATCC 11124 / CBS 356.35 / IMI 108563 / JCM 9778 / NBRC 8474) TaxID=1097556 RepID=R4XNH5_TAPDE|nr:protein of unknown function [Taphrina deformans PYCC 5710]|eukprot:CCG84794.1 protein of unknown function [Taphrina deformans PYCC 5710]
MKPKQGRKEPSERTRNLRHGTVPTRESVGEGSADGKTRVNEQVASLALRSAPAAGVSKDRAGAGKRLTTKQRRRRDQMMERASAFTEKIEQKAIETDRSQKNVKSRAMEWDQINEKAMAELYAADERVAKVLRVEE